jgi:hypothetical protein
MRLENPKSFGFSPNISRRDHDRVYEEGFLGRFPKPKRQFSEELTGNSRADSYG